MAEVDTGTLLDGRYRLTEARASGATATVWAADDEFLRRRVAVKLLHPHLTADADLLARFRDEARTAATVNHRNLVAVYDSIRDHPGIVLEWVDGPDLRRRLDAGRLGPAETAGIGADICAGLTALHQAGLVHRDVKPANILLAHGGDPKLTDFGIATANAGDRTATGIVLGTAKYLAPEQVQGGTVDGRTDVFALAAVLYEALAGEPPWLREGDLPTAIARLEADAPDLLRRRPDVPAELTGAIMRGLARDPDDRWPSATAFASALLGGSQLPAPPPRPADGIHNGPRPTPAGPSPGGAGETTLIDATTRTEPAPTGNGRARGPRRPRRRLWPRLAGFAVLAAIAVLGLVLISGARPAGDTVSSGAATGAPIVAADAFDPEGTGTPGEHDDRAGDAIDGDPTTSWPTERYGSRTFGAKSGVGLILRLDGPRTLREVRVATSGSHDWAADLHIANAAELAGAGSRADFGPVDGAGSGLPPVATIPAAGTGDTVLVWITDLGTGATPLRLEVVEVTVR